MAVMKTEMAERLLSTVPEQYFFFCHDDRVLKDLKDLSEALACMSDHTYAYHTTDGKSDFSSWVRDIVGDDKLARDLVKSSNRQQAAKQVEKRISLLTTRLA